MSFEAFLTPVLLKAPKFHLGSVSPLHLETTEKVISPAHRKTIAKSREGCSSKYKLVNNRKNASKTNADGVLSHTHHRKPYDNFTLREWENQVMGSACHCGVPAPTMQRGVLEKAEH